LKPKELLEKLAGKEDAFLEESFLAPAVKGGNLCVRLQGIVCALKVEDKNFEGWGIFQPKSFNRATCLRPAGRREIRSYLGKLPSVDVIIGEPSGSRRQAMVAHPAGSSVKVDGYITVLLVEKAGLFQHVKVRFDGFNFWYERKQPGRNPAFANYLRRSLERETDLELLDRPGLLPREKAIYADLLKLKQSTQESRDRRRIRKALEHGGAQLHRLQQKNNTFTVTYSVDGIRNRSVIRSDDLTIPSAGICLSDEDEKFDLHSLVGVLREGRRLNEFYE